MTDINPCIYLISYSRNGKVIEQHFLHTVEEVEVFKAIAHSKNCMADVFKLTDDTEESDLTNYDDIVEEKHQGKIKKFWNRPVKCVETGDIYLTIRECQKKMGISYKSLYNAIKSGNPRNGLHFILTDEKVSKVVYKRPLFMKKVLCTTTGQVFNSVKDVFSTYSISGKAFYNSIKQNKPVKGLLFKYL